MLKKSPASGDKGNPPYPPLSGGYKKARLQKRINSLLEGESKS